MQTKQTLHTFPGDPKLANDTRTQGNSSSLQENNDNDRQRQKFITPSSSKKEQLPNQTGTDFYSPSRHLVQN